MGFLLTDGFNYARHVWVVGEMWQKHSFGGITTPVDNHPDGYEELLDRYGHLRAGSLYALVGDLKTEYGIEDRPVLYGSATDTGAKPAERFKALVNPAWEDVEPEDIPGDREDAVWNIPSADYATVAHHEPLSLLREAVSERYDNDDVFGVTRLRREGAEMNTDVFIRQTEMDGIEGGDDLYLGISTGHDYTSTTKLYVDVIGLLVPESGSARVLRYLVDPRKRKHTGDAEDDVVEWYGDALERLDEVADRLYRVIGDAMNYHLDLSEYPRTMSQFYGHLGLPDTRHDLATPAAENARTLSLGTELTAWHAYKGGMKAIEDKYESRDTVAYKSHVTTVNTLLFNPSLAEKRVLSSVEKSLVEARETDEDTEATDITEWGEGEMDDPLETVRMRAKSISDGVADFKSTRERVRALLNDEGTTESETEEKELTRAEADD